MHPSWPSWFEKVELIRYLSDLKITSRNLWANLLARESPACSTAWCFCTTVWWLAVIDSKICTQEVGSAKNFRATCSDSRNSCFAAMNSKCWGKSAYACTYFEGTNILAAKLGLKTSALHFSKAGKLWNMEYPCKNGPRSYGISIIHVTMVLGPILSSKERCILLFHPHMR